MERILSAIRAIPDEACRTILIGQIEGRSLDDIYAQVIRLDPNLDREEFNRRVIACRQELWKHLKESL